MKLVNKVESAAKKQKVIADNTRSEIRIKCKWSYRKNS